MTRNGFAPKLLLPMRESMNHCTLAQFADSANSVLAKEALTPAMLQSGDALPGINGFKRKYNPINECGPSRVAVEQGAV